MDQSTSIVVTTTPPNYPEIRTEIRLQWRAKGRGTKWIDSNWVQVVDGYTDEQITDASALLLAQWRNQYGEAEHEERVVAITTIVAKREVLS